MVDTEVIEAQDSAGESGRRGTVDVRLLLEGQDVSSCRIVPLSLRIGDAVVRMEGIADVRTAEAQRYRGYSRRVMTEAVRRMVAGDASLTMLYGITDFYPKFGYITVGPETTVSLPPDGEAVVPGGYQVRAFEQDDLPSVQRLYEEMTARFVGTAVRRPDEYPWTALMETVRNGQSTECRVVTDAGGEVVGYVWRGTGLTFVRLHSRYDPDDLFLAEAVAMQPRAADAALAVCRRWAAEEAERCARDVRRVTLFMPHEGPVVAAAMQMEATLTRGYGPDGGWMARVLSAERLFSSLEPELSRRLAETHCEFRGTVRFLTEVGEAVLRVDEGGLRVVDEDVGPAPACRLPQTTLARLVMGSYFPEDLLARLDEPVDERMAELIGALFPPRTSELFLADRF